MADRIHCTEVDGVPVWWSDVDAKPFAALEFRVGRGDEPFRRAGTTHLVEHLAFHQLGERPWPVNGFVDHVQTVFHGAGRADENAAFLTDVAGAVSGLRLDRLPQEMRVLRVEAARRPPSAINALFTYRYGTESLGRAALTEHALHGATGDEVAAWARDWFTRGNAVAWMTNAPPAGFQLPLPGGERRAPGPRRNIEPLPLPSFGEAQLGGVALGGPIRRTSAGAAGTRILRARMERRLRRDLGLSYEISEAYLPVDAEEAHVSLYASCQDDQAARVASEMIGLAEALAADGPTPEEMTEDLDAFRRAHEDDPNVVLGELARAASNDLLGYPQDTTEELFAELERVAPADVAAAMTEFGRDLLGLGIAVPNIPAGWHHYPMWSVAAIGGRRLDSVAKRFPWTKGTPEIAISGEGVSLVRPDGRAVTVRFAECAGVIRTTPDVRVLFGNDGFRLRIDAAEWKDGGSAIRLIDREIPPATQVAWIDS